jgi:RNA polymerase sigma factor (sigma-70 family)
MDEASVKLVLLWQRGDQQAADKLFHRYAERLTALARSRLAAKLAGRVDPEDIVQSAYRSFFADARQGRFDLQQGGELWRLLVSITLHKLHDQVKHHTAERRSVDAEQGFGTADSLHGLQPNLIAREPSPLAALALGEEVEQLMRSLRPHERRVVELRLQGHTLYEIADLTSRSLATVCRILDRLKQRLAQTRWSSETGAEGRKQP